MATGRVWVGFICTRTRPDGLIPVTKPGLFNKRGPNLKALNLDPIKKKKNTGFIQKSQIIAKPFSLMRGKLVTIHKTHAFIFHTSHHITEFISYQTKNSTTQPNNRNHVRIRKLTQKKKKKFRERTQRGGRWLGKPRKFHSHGLTVSGDRSEREECWLGVDGGVDVEAHGGAE